MQDYEKDNSVKEEKGFKILGLPWELTFLLASLVIGVILIILKFTGMF